MAQNGSAGQVKFLQEQLKKHIQDYQRKRNWSQWIAYAIKIGIVGGGALTTIILGLKGLWVPPDNHWPTSIALVISATLTAVSAFETFNDPYWKWIRYRTTLAELYDIRDDLDYLLSGAKDIPQKEIDGLFERLKTALKKMNEEWLAKRAKVIGETPRPRK